MTSYNSCRTEEGHHNYEIQLLERTCGCGKWQNIKIHCSYVIKVCEVLRINSIRYIDPCYSLENAINTYSHAFAVPKSKSLLRVANGPKWLPNPSLLWAKGWLVKSRIRNEMDGVRRESGSWMEKLDLREN